MTNLPTTISTLNAQIGELTRQLEPVTNEQAMKGVRSLLAAGLSLPSAMMAFAKGKDESENEEQNKAPEIYAFAMAGIPRVGFQRAVQKIIRGEYEINRAFIPTPPELAAMARSEARVIREDKARLQELINALRLDKPETISNEGRAKVKALLSQFRSKDSERRARETVPDMPLDEEKAAYYEKILAMNDLPNVSVEQAEYRSQMKAKVESSRS